MLSEHQPKVADLKAYLQIIENLKTARTEAQYKPISETLSKLRDVCLASELSPDVASYLADVLTNAVNFIVNHKQYPDSVLCDIEHFLKSVLLYIRNNLDSNNLKLSNIFRVIMDPVRMLHEYNSHCTDVHESMAAIGILTYSYSLNPRYKEFLESLKAGDFIDVLRLDRGTGRSCWSRAQITQVANDHFIIRYLNELPTETSVPFRSGFVMPFESRSHNYEALLKLMPGDPLIATQTDKWVRSFVKNRMESINEHNEVIVTYDIAFRYYSEDGNNIEEFTERRYFGYNKYHDEIINANSPRILPFNCGLILRPIQGETSFIDDSLDLLYESDHTSIKFPAILRPKQSKSTLLVRLINYFGEIGGFENILQRFSVHNQTMENWIPVDVLANLLQGLGNVHAQLFKKFATDFVPRLVEVVRDNLLKAPDMVIRSMGKEKMHSITESCKLLLDRAETEEQRKAWVSQTTLDLVIICFNCNYLDKKIMGLKFLSDFWKQAHNEKASKQEQFLLKWIQDQGILVQLFSKNTHLQLLARSADLIRQYLMIEQALGPYEMELIWNLMREDDAELRPTIFKVMYEVSAYMRDPHVEFFQNKMGALPLESLLPEHVQLLYDLNRYQLKNKELIMQAQQILWSVVEYHSQFTDYPRVHIMTDKLNKTKDLEEKARQYFCDLLKNLEHKDPKLTMIQKMIDNILKERVESSSFKTLSVLIHSFSVKEEPTQEEIVKLLLRQGIQTVILEAVKSFRKRAEVLRSDQEWPIEASALYMNRLQERLLLVKSMIRINKTAFELVNLEFLKLIWSELILRPFCKQEADMASNWLRDLIEKDREPRFHEILERFYEENFGGEAGSVELTENAFDCYQALLTEVNSKRGFMLKNEFSFGDGITATVNQFGKVTQMTNTVPEDEPPEPEYQICVHPDKIVGIDYLWHIVYENNKSPALQEKAAALLVKLHLNLNVAIKELGPEILKELIEKVISKIKNTHSQQVIQRSLQLMIRQMLNQSETRGIGKLKSLGGLTRGEVFTVSIQNELTNEPKKTQLKVFSNWTVMELRIQIAKLIKTSWDQVKIMRGNIFNNNREVADVDNGKTLNQVGIKKTENLIISKRKTPPIPQMELLNAEGDLIPTFKEIARKWFMEYSTDGKMSAEQLARFTSKAAGDLCQVQDTRIKEFLQNYVKNEDQLIREDEFLEFYKDSCGQSKNISAVWKNLNSFNYRNDLKNLSEIQDVKVEESKLPRFILANHESFFQLIFTLLRTDQETAQIGWRLLNQLPVSEQVRQQITDLKQHQNWDQIFPQDEPYRLLYSLKIVEFLLGEDTSDVDNNDDVIIFEETESTFNNEWRHDFINCGGFGRLYVIFSNTLKQPINAINRPILTFILHIFKTYLAGVLQPVLPNIYQIQAHVKQPIQATLELIAQALDNTRESSEQNFQKVKGRAKEPEDFWNLVKDLQINNLGKMIIDQIPWRDLLNQVDQLLEQTISKDEIDVEERSLIELGLQIFTTLLGSDLNQIAEYFIQSTDRYTSLIQKGIFIKKQLMIRKYFSNSLYLVFLMQPSTGQTIIKILLDIFPSADNKDTQQYFDTLCRLIEEQHQPNLAQYSQLAQQMMKLIEDTDTSEVRSNQFNDKTLCGYMQMIESLAKVRPDVITQEFASYLLRKCLFCSELVLPQLDPNAKIVEEFNPRDYVKCKSPESRKIVYKILNMAVKVNFSIYLNLINLTNLVSQIPLFTTFEVKPGKDMKSYLGYVGIRNLGCICYMNSMIQQFYMTPEFRYAMLRALDGKDTNLVQVKQPDGFEYQFDDNIFHQFQRFLAYLELSDRPDFPPYQFCQAFKDYDGKPVNVALQQDSQEFLGSFFDKLEHSLKSQGWHHFIEGVYGGKTCIQMICQGCGNLREKFDLFYTLSVRVKGVKNIHESFESMVNGEMINDYFCEACQTRNNLQKRQCLESLPNVMIVHLQRILYNLDTGQNEKLSSRLEFPHQLNLEAYTREALLKLPKQPKEFYDYKLKGIVVHKGTALYGHYYSIINHKADKWIRFNDSQIEDFDIRKLATESFGGKESEDGQEYWSPADVASTNAYILVYEKVHKQPFQIAFANEQQKEQIMSKFQCTVQEGLVQKLEYPQIDKYIPAGLYYEVWMDNHRFMFERHAYSEDFFKFLRELSDGYTCPADFEKLKNLDQVLPYEGIYVRYHEIPEQEQHLLYDFAKNYTYLVIEVISKAAEHGCIKDYVVTIKNILNLIPLKAYTLFQEQLKDKSNKIIHILTQAPDHAVRQAVGSLILHVLNVMIYIHNLSLDLNLLQVLQTEDQIIVCEQVVIRFVLELIHRLPNEVAKNASKFSQFFDFIRDFFKSGVKKTDFAQQIELVSILADFFMEKGSPLWANAQPSPINFNFGEKKYQLTTKLQVPFYSPIFQTIAYLLQGSYQLSANDLMCLQYQFFYQKAIQECSDLNAITAIIVRMAWQNEAVSRTICDVLLEGISRANYENVHPLLHMSTHLISIVDDLQEQRIEWLLGFPEPLFQNKTDYTTGCGSSLNEQSTTYSTLISPFDANTGSILNKLFSQSSNYKFYSIQLMKFLLTASNTIRKVFSYLVSLPPPNYVYFKYYDWFEEFLADYQEDVNRNPTVGGSIFFNKAKELEETMQQFQAFKSQLKEFFSDMIPHSDEPIFPLFIVGQLAAPPQLRDTLILEGVSLRSYDMEVYLTKSLPQVAPKTNLVFPAEVLYDNLYVQPQRIDPNCALFKLLMPRPTCNIPKPPPIPLAKKNVIDGVDFSTEVTKDEYQDKVNSDFVNEISNFAMELEAIPNVQSGQAQDVPVPLDDGKQKEPLIQVDVPLQKAVYLRRYMLMNETEQTLNVTFSISIEDSFINFRLPRKVCKLVPPKQECYLVTLQKTIPDMDWGDFQEQVDIHNPPRSVQPQQQQPKKQVRIDEEVQVYPAPSNSQEYGPHLPTSTDETISCPQCTVVQSAQNNFCECCYLEFK